MPPKKKAANGYKFAEPLPKGIILEDLLKKKWRLGPSIGKGGFGEIYCAQDENLKGLVYPYVIKIEPHANGPLFVETHFYIKHAKATEIENFKKEKGLKLFGMPVYHGSGSIEYKKEKYRFLVMDKFSTDLYKLYIDNNKVFPTDTVFKLGLQILDVLEYIHQRGYVHADIKAANLLLGSKESQNKQVYLVDFGLATKYTMDKEFKPNPKKAHDGTIEFLSRDAHQGVQTRRGDLEILAYNLIQWLGCKLPWEGNLNDPKVVQGSKEENMATVPKMIKASFGSKTSPKAIVEFLKYLKTLKFNTEPDYNKIRDIFISGVKEGNGSICSPLNFSESKTPLKRTRTPVSKSREKKTKPSKDEVNNKVSDDEVETPKLRKRATVKNVVSKDDKEMASSDSERFDGSFITKRKCANKDSSNKLKKRKSRSLQDLSNDIDFEGYNDAMKEIKLKKLRGGGRKNQGNSQKTPLSTNQHEDDNMAGFTDEMKAIALRKKLKAETGKRSTTTVPIATTSKASDRRGLVKPSSRRLQKKSPKTHGEVLSLSDASASD